MTIDKVFCPFCSVALPLWGDRRRFVPVISKEGDFQVRCRSKKCQGRKVDIDIRTPVMVV